jgi:hypothetical protein
MKNGAPVLGDDAIPTEGLPPLKTLETMKIYLRIAASVPKRLRHNLDQRVRYYVPGECTRQIRASQPSTLPV